MMIMINHVCIMFAIEEEAGTSPTVPHIQFFHDSAVVSFVICIVVETVNVIDKYVR